MNLREAVAEFRRLGGTVEKVHGSGEIVFKDPRLPRRVRVNERRKDANEEAQWAVRRLRAAAGEKPCTRQ